MHLSVCPLQCQPWGPCQLRAGQVVLEAAVAAEEVVAAQAVAGAAMGALDFCPT